jgi:hypothetical protein
VRDESKWYGVRTTEKEKWITYKKKTYNCAVIINTTCPADGRAAESRQLFDRAARFKDDKHAHAHRLALRPAVGDAGGQSTESGGVLPLGGDGGMRPVTCTRRSAITPFHRESECGTIAGIDYLIIVDGSRVLVTSRGAT